MEKQMAKKLSFVVFGAVAVMAAACTSSDINDVYEGPAVTAEENPLQGLNPSSSFTWSTMEHSKVTIEVNDRFNDQYDYYVNLYAENPRTTNKPNALFSGVARGNKPATLELDFPGSTTNIYVEVKDPQGYVTTYGYAAPKAEASVTLPCVTGKAAQGDTKEVEMPDAETRAVYYPDFEIPEPEAITSLDWTIPADAVELPDTDMYQITADYVVPANTTITLTGHRGYQPDGNAKTRIYVAGTLDIQDFRMTILDNTELYILDGGKITGNKVVPQSGAIIAVQEGGEACLKVIHSEGTGGDVYVAGTMYLSETLNLNQVDTHAYIAPTGRLIGAEKGSQALDNEDYTLVIEYMQGQLYVDANEDSSGQVLCASVDNKNGTAQIVLAENARMIVNGAVVFQCPIYNAGLFSAASLDGGNVYSAKIYNTCTMIVKDFINGVENTFVKHGTICGGITTDAEGALEFSPLQKFSYPSSWNVNIFLMNGSYMDVKDTDLAKVYIQGYELPDASATSLLRVRGNFKTAPLSWGAGAICAYNLIVEYDEETSEGGVKCSSGASTTGLEEAAIELENCTGTIIGRVEDPNDDIVQTNPYVGSVQSGYTVNFEDQWPVVGDYDVNDIVLHMDKIETMQMATAVKEAVFTINLKAVGAGYMLGAGIQLDNITNADIAAVEYSLKEQAGMLASDKGAFSFGSNGAEDGAGTDAAILPICYDAHKAFLNKVSLADGERKPLNTGSSRSDGRSITIKVTFADDATIAPEDLMVSALNFFIFRPEDEAAIGGKRVEVHLKGYAPTRVATDVYLGMGNDASTGNNYYVSADGFPWGIIVNDINGGDATRAWSWPKESKLITSEYSSFAQWVNSNGADATNWMVPAE